MIKRLLALCLCAALLCGAACAEGIREICFGLDYMHYGCTLADGRMGWSGRRTWRTVMILNRWPGRCA